MRLTGSRRESAAFLFLLLLSLVLVRDSSGSALPKRILMLFPYESNMPGFVDLEKSFRSTLNLSKDYKFEFYVECMDLTRFPSEAYHDKLVQLYREKYSEVKIDLMVASLRPSLNFLGQYGPESFQKTPILLIEQDPILFDEPAQLPVAATVFGELDMRGALSLAMRLHPDVRRVFVVTGASRFDRRLEEMARELFRDFQNGVEFNYLSGLPMEELIQKTSSLPERSLLFYVAVFRDGAGEAFKSRDALALISERANAPIYSVSDSYIGYGIVGGRLISHSLIGARAAEAALSILSGADRTSDARSSDKIVSRYIFDARYLKSWGIREADLPVGSEVRFKDLSVWETHRWQIVGVLSVLLLQTLLIAALIVSVGKRRMADRALREAELKYRTVADFTHDWEYWAAPDGRLLYVSPACERITGYSSERFLEAPGLFRRIIDPEDCRIWEEHAGGNPLKHKSEAVQLRIRTKDGNTRWIEHVCRPVTDDRGVYRGIRASNRDITERKHAELEAQLHGEELAHLTRVVTIGELASTLAHEINQPLTAILCNAQAAQRYLSHADPDLEEVRTILEDIIEDDRRTGEVIRRMRTLVRKENPRRESVVLNDAVWEAMALIRSASFLEGLITKAELDPELPAVQGDRVQLQQVVLNFLLNATAAMRNTPKASRKLVVRTAMKDDANIIVTVGDSGTGIDGKTADHLFEPFFTTKADGLGMGLSISRTIVKAHGGTIGAENNPEGGAMFYFTLPVAGGGLS